MTKMPFPQDEHILTEKLGALFNIWKESAKNKEFIDNYKAEHIIKDGFYPYYTRQKVKVLFIGRESLSLGSESYIDTLYEAYKTNSIGIDKYQFHKFLFNIAYGLNNNCPRWQDIPKASSLLDSFSTLEGISFAFMNLSKFSNDSDNWQANWSLIDSFTTAFKDEVVNYFNKEIEILNPDLIITMNLEGRLSVLGQVELLKPGSALSYHQLTVNERQIPLFDTYHFSAIGKSGEHDFYNPIISTWQELNSSR